MSTKSLTIIFSVVAILLSCSSNQTNIDYVTALNQIKNAYFLRDYEQGFILGEKYVSHFPDSLELKAWYLLNWNKNHYWNHDNIIPVAQKMIEKYDKNPWGYFALAGIYAQKVGENKSKEALELSEKALKIAPKNPYTLWMRAEALNFSGKYDEVITLVNQIELNDIISELLVQKGRALKRQGLTFRGEIKIDEKWQQALQTFDKAFEHNPKCVNALMEKVRSRPIKEDTPILEKALQISPYSNFIRFEYWTSLFANKDLDQIKREEITEKDIEFILKERSEYPSALHTVQRLYLKRSFNNPEKQKYYGDIILKNFPNSYEAEWILIQDIREFKKKNRNYINSESAITKKWRDNLWNYCSRPQHYMSSLLAEVYSYLFRSVINDSTISNEELVNICQLTIKYASGGSKDRIRSDVAVLLAERTSKQKDSEKIVKESIKSTKDFLHSIKPDNISSHDWENKNGKLIAPLYDALGRIQFMNNKLKDAEQSLLLADKLQNSKRYIHKHHYYLGQLYEEKKEFEQAESYYSKGMNIQTPLENPNEGALKNLYIKINGNNIGLEDYLSEIRGQNEVDRKKKILDSRYTEPAMVENFSLENLKGEQIKLSALKDKVVVLNFWFIGCYYCEKEFPEFQMLHDKYKNDPDVFIFSVNGSDTKENIIKWINEKKYDFDVLIDNSLIKKHKILGFPTTLFIDKNRKIAFKKEGWSKELFEEFSWRIEALL